MKKIQVLCCLLALSLAACQKQQKQEYSGVEGDYVNGTPLPPRQEGVSFFSNNVAKGQFQPVYFAFDSFEIAADEGNELRQIGSFLKLLPKILFWPGSPMREARRNTIAGSGNAELRQRETFCSR